WMPEGNIDESKTEAMNDLVSQGAKEIIFGQNEYKARMVSSLFDMESARNRAIIEMKLNDNPGARVPLKLGSRMFDMRVLAIGHRNYYPAWLCYENNDQAMPGKFRIARLDRDTGEWKDTNERFDTEDEFVNSIDKISKVMSEDEQWYDADKSSIRKIVRIVTNAGEDVGYHKGQIQRQLARLNRQKRLLEEKINSARAWLGQLDARRRNEPNIYTQIKATEDYINALTGFGGTSRIDLRYDDKYELPNDFNLFSSLDSLPIHMTRYDPNGDAEKRIYYVRGTNLIITYGMEALKYRMGIVEAQLANSTLMDRGARFGMVIRSDKDTGVDDILIGPENIEKYEDKLTELARQKGSLEAVKYNKYNNSFEYEEKAIVNKKEVTKRYKITIVYGLEGAKKQDARIKKGMTNAKIYSEMLKLERGGALIEGIRLDNGIYIPTQDAILEKGPEKASELLFRLSNILKFISEVASTDPDRAIEMYKLLYYGRRDVPVSPIIEKARNNRQLLKALITDIPPNFSG
ncbi:MAG: hypothetical protein AAB267_06930, partial [Candidatus Desantisbacteria bacterium]